jgi:hypothetical protein
MEVNTILDLFPLWVVCLMTAAVFVLSIELGYRLARYQRDHSKEINEAPVGPMVGAILGLLAFMLAFTFGFAASRFEERKQILLNEVNIIRTAFLRAELQPEPIGTESHALLREYIDVRLGAGTDRGKLSEAVERSEQLQAALWQQAKAAAEKGRPPINSLFITSVNDIIDVHSRRVNVAIRNRVPGVVWIVLYTLVILGMLAIGYQAGLASAKRSLTGITLVLAFTAVITMIADLDRPGGGLLRVNQQGMSDLKTFVNTTN